MKPITMNAKSITNAMRLLVLVPGNDREGGFEVLLSEDGTQAKGVWWYLRVGTQKNIPPREHGGTYTWKRLTQPPTAQ